MQGRMVLSKGNLNVRISTCNLPLTCIILCVMLYCISFVHMACTCVSVYLRYHLMTGLAPCTQNGSSDPQHNGLVCLITYLVCYDDPITRRTWKYKAIYLENETCQIELVCCSRPCYYVRLELSLILVPAPLGFNPILVGHVLMWIQHCLCYLQRSLAWESDYVLRYHIKRQLMTTYIDFF